MHLPGLLSILFGEARFTAVELVERPERSFDFGFWILDFGLTPCINALALDDEIF